MNVAHINHLIAKGLVDGEAGSVSDGYHTFDELYEHRIELYLLVCALLAGRHHNVPVWKSKKHSDGFVLDGRFALGLFKDKGNQITYHLPMTYWDMCSFAEELETAPEFDGHKPGDVLMRLSKLTYLFMP